VNKKKLIRLENGKLCCQVITIMYRPSKNLKYIPHKTGLVHDGM